METPSSVSPENAGGSFSFNVGGEGFGFDGKFTAGRFTGMIRGVDGKEFAGFVEDLGGGRYKIENWEVGWTIESPAEVGTAVAEALAAAPAEAPIGGLEDAAALAAMDVAPAQQVVVESQSASEPVVEATVELPTAVVEAAPVKEPAVEAAQPPASEPAPEPEPVPEPEIAAAPAEAGQRPTIAEARQQFDKEFGDLDARVRGARYDAERKTALQKQASELRAKGEEARSSVNRLRNKVRISEAISEEGRLKSEAGKLESEAAAITVLEEDQVRAIEDRRQRVLELTQEIGRWENLTGNPALIEEYRGLDGRMQEDLTVAEKLFGGGNPEDQAVLDAARKRIEARTQVRRTELEAMFPRRFMELAGMAPRQDLGDAAVDYSLDRDLIERYYQFADQFYAELTGQPQAVQAEMPPPEQVVPQEPVEQPVVETTVEEAMPVAEAVAEPEVAEQAVEVPAPPGTEGEVAPAPIEVPVEGSIPDQVVTDAEEQARAAAAKPAGTMEAPAAPVEAEMPGEAAETPEQRFERRKRGFAGALAELDKARSNTSGTEGEQKVRLVEAYNQAIGAAMELMEEGETAKEVVKGFFAGALGTPGGRKLTEVAVRSRMDEAGVTKAPAGEKKKKLEQAGLLGLLELLLELGMSFTDKTIGAVVSEVQSATGGGR